MFYTFQSFYSGLLILRKHQRVSLKRVVKLNIKKQTAQLKNGQRTWTDIFLKKTYKWSTGTWTDAQHHWSVETCKSKSQWHITSHLSEWLLSKRQQICVDQDVKKREPSYTMENSMELSQKIKNRTITQIWQFHFWVFFQIKVLIQVDTCTLTLTAILLAIAKTQKQPQCPSREEWIKTGIYIHTHTHTYLEDVP